MTLILRVVVHLAACLKPMSNTQEAVLSCWSFMNKHISVCFYSLKIDPGTLSKLRVVAKYWAGFFFVFVFAITKYCWRLSEFSDFFQVCYLSLVIPFFALLTKFNLIY